MSLLLEDLTRICRLCLSTTEVCTSLYENNGDEIVFGLTSINISDNNDLPTGACSSCWENLNLAYRIQQEIIENNNKLIQISKNKLKPVSNKDALCSSDAFSENSFQMNSEFVDAANIKEEPDLDDDNVENNANDADLFSNGCCTICNSSVSDSKMENHIRDHFSEPQKCDECNMELENVESYQQHIINKHCDNSFDVFVCKCSATFKLKCFYKIHMEKAHCDSKVENILSDEILNEVKIEENELEETANTEDILTSEFRCLTCNKKCKDHKNLLYHQRNKHKKRRCPICNFEATSDNYSKHLRTHTVKKIICNICGKVLKNEDVLRVHIYHSHTAKSYKCPECDKTFKTNYQMKLHLRRNHTGERNYVCELCGKAFYIENARTAHYKRIHLKQHDYLCKYCNKGFATSSSKRIHERQHTNEAPYKCEVCGEGFKQNSTLRAHKKSKHKIKEETSESCTVCGKKFGSKHAIQVHMYRVHQ